MELLLKQVAAFLHHLFKLHVGFLVFYCHDGLEINREGSTQHEGVHILLDALGCGS